jgi:hypothetical protein
MRLGLATPDEKRCAFDECLAGALSGHMPPSETGLNSATVDTLEAIARVASQQQPTDELVAAARAALSHENDL